LKGYQQIRPEIDQYNIWNSETWWFTLETGQLVMFPSSTIHQVDTKQGNNTRISLAFNTFYKGTIGSNSNLTELIL
jgi:predicted 2-oxoglutarate/Fe(II)-dependent dioxygenase YbiX